MKQALAVGIVLALGAGPAAADAGQLPPVITAAKRVKQFRDLQMTDKEEQELGAAVSDRIRERYGVVQNAAVHRYMALVGTVVARAGSRPALPWTFIVLDTDAVNAFATPGGYVHVTRGALALMRDEAELAGVLGHEVIHITEKHTIRAIQRSKAVQMGAQETLSGNAALFERAVTATYENIVEKGFGRGEEHESDDKGIALADAVGYDPKGLGRFLARLQERNKASTERRGLFASHPEIAERIERLEKRIAAEKLGGTATAEARFRKTITYKPAPLASIAVVEGGAAGLTGGDTKKTDASKADGKADEKTADEPKKRGFGLSRMLPGGGGEKKSAQVTGSGAARGVDPERDAKGGANKKPVAVTISAADIAAFKKEGGLK